MTSSQIPAQLKGEFVPGAITKIKLTNFLIYDNVVVWPGPHLNVIIGPNATGKSTIVNAICLGLAGKTSILGRAKDVTAYIKAGRNKGTIEITLQGGANQNDVVITRVISKGGTPTTTWLINGKPSQQKMVEETVGSMGIQISNLCQFLPQDRVADFIKMSNNDLLVNTMQAADYNLYELYCNLKETQKLSQQVDTDFTRLQENLERERTLNAALERDVSSLEEKKKYEKELTELKQKRPWVEYEASRLEYVQKREEKNDIDKKLKELKAKNAPAEEAVKKLKVKVDVKIAEFQDMGPRILNASRGVSSLNENLQGFTDKLEEVESQLRRKEQEEATRLKKLEAMKVQITSLQQQLESLKELNLKPEIDSLVQHIGSLTDKKHDLEEEMRNINLEKENKRHEIIAIESDLKRMKDIDSQRLNVVRRVDRHTYDAILWLRRHRSEFEDVIYEPPLMTLNVREKTNAKYLENTISFNDLKTFICINPADHEKFYKKVRQENKLIINAAVALTRGPEAYTPPAPIESYSSYGLQGYLKDMVEAPGPVMAYLCHLAHLHKIPAGNHIVNDYVDEIPETCPGITRYLSNTHSYSYKKSRYSNNVITRSVDLKAASMLIYAQDEQRLDELTNSLKVLRSEEGEINKKVDELKTQIAGIENEIEKTKEERKALIKKQNERKSVEEKLNIKKMSLLQFEQDKVDIEKERAQCNKQLMKINRERIEAFKRHAEKIQAVADLCKRRCKLALTTAVLSVQYRQQEMALNEKSIEARELERLLTEKKSHVELAKKKAMDLHNIAKEVVGGSSSLSAEMQKIFSKLPNTLEEIDAMIADIQTRVDLIFVDRDRQILEEYERGKETIKKLEARIAHKTTNQVAYRDEIDNIKSRWLPPLQEIIERINIKFSRFFQEIDCAGEVHLKIPPNQYDFDTYGIGINVKYGDNKPMKELTTFQSGGERSVATVLYMLSLQELSKSPFRCVDEINQGMDAENERKVFELVVKTACQPNTPQYFLLTPKLLPDLLYTERMCVHIVHNGPYMLETSQWNINDFIQKRGQFDDDDD